MNFAHSRPNATSTVASMHKPFRYIQHFWQIAVWITLTIAVQLSCGCCCCYCYDGVANVKRVSRNTVCKQSENHTPSVLCVCLHRTSHVSVARFVGFLALPHRSNYGMHAKNAVSFGYCRIFCCSPFLANEKIHSGDTPKWTLMTTCGESAYDISKSAHIL